MRHNNIVSAIEWLPEHLFTEEIVEAAVQSKEIEVLSHIPGRFLTSERIERIIAGSTESWHSFELRNIPEECRSQAVCDFAIRKRSKNIASVPEAMITRGMVEEIIKHGRGDFDILANIPERLWDAKLAYTALRCYIYEPYSTSDRNQSIMETNLILGYVAGSVKTREFYYGMLDETKISSTVTDTVTPSRFKNKAYYIKMAEHDLSLVPARFYSHEILRAAVCSTDSTNLITDPQFFKPLSVYLDDMLADRLMQKHPYMFHKLPKTFKTPERLVIAIDNSKRETNYYIEEETERHLLTMEVCKAYVRRNGNCPEFPKKVWTRKFVDYCMEYGTSFRWYSQMPKEFQTSANTQAAYDYSQYHICDFAKQFITPQMAKACYRGRCYERAIPEHFLTEFCRQTGLPEKFYGGETSLLSLKNERINHTYCKIGNTYLAFYLKEAYEPSTARLMMTRTDSRYCTPEKVFDIQIGTFHRTWLEKIVAENDPRFVKPCVDKSLRAVQAVCYYGVEKVKDLKRTEIFHNTFMGETIGYCARRRDLTYHCDNCEALIEGLKFKIRGMAVPVTFAEDMTPYTADLLHQKFGFCHVGMTAFANDYGLDMEKAYTAAQMRQIVREKGSKPSLRSYQRELKRINII
uniref:Uncharacterized protein n=1 Tax=virus sp. ct5rm7 TaxID=2827298 RepID=A0A8S5RGD7_9VIRU|nr:MAG TPA: hypothetical protein [virus sp. ct5rm7]